MHSASSGSNEKRKPAGTPQVSMGQRHTGLANRATSTEQSTVPPSTAIRSRFRDMVERPTQQPPGSVSRGTKRLLVDDSPNDHSVAKTSQLETPVRGEQLLGMSPHKTPILHSGMQPIRLFSGSPSGSSIGNSIFADFSPARSILNSARKETEYVGKMESMKRELERTKFELKQVELERERDREEATRLRQSLEADVLAQTKRVEKLERDRKWLAGQEEQFTEQRKELEAEMKRQMERYKKKVEQAIAEYRQKALQVEEAEHAFRKLKKEHVSEISGLHDKLSKAEHRAGELSAQLEAARASSGSNQDKALQYTIDSLERKLLAKEEDLQELMQRQQSGQDAASTPSRDRIVQLERNLHEQCSYIKALEKQNSQLGTEAQHAKDFASKYAKELELSQALQAKVYRLEGQHENFAELEAQLSLLKQEREQWRKVFQGYPSTEQKLSSEEAGRPIDSPYAVANTVAAQRHKISLLETKVETMQETVDSATRDLQTAAFELESYKQQCLQLDEQLTKEKRRVVQLERSKQYALREADFLRSQLHSYDNEEATMMTGNYDTQKTERIKQLELFIDEQRTWISSLEGGEPQPLVKTEAATLSAAVLQGYREEAERKECELQELRRDYDQLMKRFEELEKEAARLEHQIGAGLRYNPRTTRILQLKDNPSAQDYAIRSEKLKALVAENEALLAHIKKLSGASPDNTKAEAANGERDEDEDEDEDGDEDPPSDSPFFQTIANLRSENQELSKQLKDLGKMMLRYKKEWKWKVVELREVIGSIMGYRLDFLPNGSVRCTSVYAADPGESFVFNSGDDNKGNMKLYGGGNKEYLNSCMNQIRFWIQERGSIPGFMASLTLQNFEDRQKDLKPK